jgi:hypothetical protein
VNKIVFIDEVPLSQRLYERYGIQILLDAGFLVEIWDFIPFLAPGLVDFPVSDPLRFKGIRSFRTKREALMAIRQEPRATVFVIDIGYCFQTLQIFQALSCSNHVYGIQLLDAQPSSTEKFHDKMTFWIPIIAKSPREVANAVFRKIPTHWLSIQPPDFVFRGGTASIDRRYAFGKPVREICAHSLDYDLFIKERETAERDVDVPLQDYAVFLDQFLPFHPDFFYLGMPFPVKAEDYYPKLNLFFKRVEGELGLKVVVGAHPKSYYERLPDYFAGRKVIRGHTIKLVRDAKLVLVHDSAALNFVVLYHKPVLFLSYALHPGWIGRINIDRTASLFGKQPINLDDLPSKIDWQGEFKVNEAAYKIYQEKFIKQSGSTDKPSWQIFADFIKSLG